MSLIVRARGAYRAEVSSDWRPDDYFIRNLVKSLKGDPFNGYSNFRMGGKDYQIEAKDSEPAYLLWSNWAAIQLRDVLRLGQVTLVPVPSSVHVRFGQDTCPVRMANSIAARAPRLASVGNFLRHKAKQAKSHSDGGTRDPEKIESALVCNVTDSSRPIVLIDDVMTTGGHLLACARALRKKGASVEHTLVAGRTVWEAVEDPNKVPAEDIEAILEIDDIF
jgi:hypothetical protein